MRDIENPVTHQESNRGTVTSHPAFASISLTRSSGSCYLFGSDFQHQQSIRLRISPAVLCRNLSGDSVFDERLPMIEVALSHDQFAKMVSSIGTSPTPCTLTTFDRKSVPGLPAPVARTEQFAQEANDRMESARADLREALAAVQESKLSRKDKDTLCRKLAAAEMNIGTNLKFVADQFGEHMEEVVNAARSEVDAYVGQSLQRNAAMALSQESLPLLSLPTISASE